MKNLIILILLTIASCGDNLANPVPEGIYTSNDADPCRKYGIPGTGEEFGNTRQTLTREIPGTDLQRPDIESLGVLLIDIRTISCGDYMIHDLQARLMYRHETLKPVDSDSITLLEPDPFTEHDWQDIKIRFALTPEVPDSETSLELSVFIWEDEATHQVFHKAY